MVARLAGVTCAVVTACLAVWLVNRVRNAEEFQLGADGGIAGPVKVHVERATGIIHIESLSEDPDDLFFAQGLVMAQTRTFQMEFQRRLAAGTLAEIAGAAAVPQDTLFRTFGFAHVANQTLARMQADPRFAEEMRILERFGDGVNHFFTSSARFVAPLELIVLSLIMGTPFPWQLEPWTPLDSIAWVLVMSYGLSGNLQRELMRFKLIADRGLDVARVNELLPPFDLAEFPTIVQPEDVCEDQHAQYDNATCVAHPGLQDWLETFRSVNVESVELAGAHHHQASAPSSPLWWDFRPSNAFGIFGASNNWVVSGNMTVDGTPLLANDPHLELTAPNVWLLMHLKDAAHQVDVMGACFLGVPFVVLGRNRHLAWGVTNTGADAQDLFVLEATPNDRAYLHNGNEIPFEHRVEELVVAGEVEPRRLTIRSAPHYGPVISDHGLPDVILRTQKGDSPAVLGGNTVALRWTSLLADEPEHFDTSLIAFMRMCRMRNLEEARTRALKYLVAPGQNFVMATQSEIGYQMTGRFPVRVEGHTGLFPVPGNGSYDWGAHHYVAFEDMPQVTNPKQGFVATANNRVQPPCFPVVPSCDFDSTDGYRAKRITEMIKGKGGQHSVITMQEIQQDVTSLFAQDMQEVLTEACTRANASELVEVCSLLGNATGGDWAHRMSVGSLEATLFNMWEQELEEITASETGVRFWAVPLFATLAFRRAAEATAGRSELSPTNGSLCALNMSEAECMDYATAALERVGGLLAKGEVRPWGMQGMHETCFSSQLFQGTPVDCIFSRRVAHGGDAVTVNVGTPSHPGFDQHEGSSFRAIMSMGAGLDDDGKSVIVNALGQSGSPLSRHYDDMVAPWSEGWYFHMSLSDFTANGPTRTSCLAADLSLCV